MKAVIKKVEFVKEYPSKYGQMFLHKVYYGESYGLYSSKSKDQTKFKGGEEAEFTEEERSNDKGTFINIKPISNNPQSNFGRQLKKEQSRYTTMGASYVKDLIIAGKLEMKDWEKATEKIVKFMFNLDKEIEK